MARSRTENGIYLIFFHIFRKILQGYFPKVIRAQSKERNLEQYQSTYCVRCPISIFDYHKKKKVFKKLSFIIDSEIWYILGILCLGIDLWWTRELQMAKKRINFKNWVMCSLRIIYPVVCSTQQHTTRFFLSFHSKLTDNDTKTQRLVRVKENIKALVRKKGNKWTGFRKAEILEDFTCQGSKSRKLRQWLMQKQTISKELTVICCYFSSRMIKSSQSSNTLKFTQSRSKRWELIRTHDMKLFVEKTAEATSQPWVYDWRRHATTDHSCR